MWILDFLFFHKTCRCALKTIWRGQVVSWIPEQICPAAHPGRKYRPRVHWVSQLYFVTWIHLKHSWPLKVRGIIHFPIEALQLYSCWISLTLPSSFLNSTFSLYFSPCSVFNSSSCFFLLSTFTLLLNSLFFPLFKYYS